MRHVPAVLAMLVKLVDIWFDYFGREVIFNGVRCDGLFQHILGLPFGADLEGGLERSSAMTTECF
jgi:hypothetical protein